MKIVNRKLISITILILFFFINSSLQTKSEETIDGTEEKNNTVDENKEKYSGIVLVLIIIGVTLGAMLLCHVVIIVRNCVSYALLPVYLEDNCLCKKVMKLHPKYVQDTMGDA